MHTSITAAITTIVIHVYTQQKLRKMTNNNYEGASSTLMEDQITAFASCKLALSNQDFLSARLKDS